MNGRWKKDGSKIVKTFFVLILVCLLCSQEMLTPAMADAAGKRKVHLAYEKVISSLKEMIGELDYYVGRDLYFAYYDINNDGIDELFAQSSVDDKNSALLKGGTDVFIYTYANGKSIKLLESLTAGGNWGGYYYRGNSKYITFYSRMGWSEGEYIFKKLSGGKLVKAGTCSYVAKDFNDASAGYIYKVNGKKVKEKQYNKYLKKMEGTKELRMYKATDANLRKLR